MGARGLSLGLLGCLAEPDGHFQPSPVFELAMQSFRRLPTPLVPIADELLEFHELPIG